MRSPESQRPVRYGIAFNDCAENHERPRVTFIAGTEQVRECRSRVGISLSASVILTSSHDRDEYDALLITQRDLFLTLDSNFAHNKQILDRPTYISPSHKDIKLNSDQEKAIKHEWTNLLQ